MPTHATCSSVIVTVYELVLSPDFQSELGMLIWQMTLVMIILWVMLPSADGLFNYYSVLYCFWTFIYTCIVYSLSGLTVWENLKSLSHIVQLSTLLSQMFLINLNFYHYFISFNQKPQIRGCPTMRSSHDTHFLCYPS